MFDQFRHNLFIGNRIDAFNNLFFELLIRFAPNWAAEILNAEAGHARVTGYFSFLFGKIVKDKGYGGFLEFGFDINAEANRPRRANTSMA